MDNAAYFRQQMFQNASVHGGVDSNIKPTQADTSDKMKKAMDTAKLSSTNVETDPIVKVLFDLFLPQARTDEGRAKAVSMAAAIVKKLREEFDITPKAKANEGI